MAEKKGSQIFKHGPIVVVNEQGAVQKREPTPGMQKAQQLGLTRRVVFQEHNPNTYQRPLDAEVAAYREGILQLGEMTPAYAHAMVWGDLKKARESVKTFVDEMNLARMWQSRLGELAEAFHLPEGHISIDTSGPVLHVFPEEVAGQTLGPSGHPLHFQMLERGESYLADIGRGFEAILPTHVQASGYNTPAHPEMDSSVSAQDAIPSLRIGKYVRIGGSFNAQGSEPWVFDDNAWLGQGSYIISQEHPADRPSNLGRSRSETSFPGMHIGTWAWVAKQAQLLYRTQYVGKGSVVASHAKINTWVSDYSLVTSEDKQHAFYPVKAYVLDTLGIRDTQDVLALDWGKVETLFQQEYQQWRQKEHLPDKEVATALTKVRQNVAGRVLFIGSKNEANILHAASPTTGDKPLRRIDVMTVAGEQQTEAFTMQALNGMNNRTTRFREVDTLTELPIGQFYQEPLYDLVVVETSARACCDGGRKINKMFEEAQRLVRPGGEIVATLHDVNEYESGMVLPPYVTRMETDRQERDTMVLHMQGVVNKPH